MHLHIICTNPCANSRQLIVPVTTWINALCDATCILNVGDHPFIRHESWVMYRAIKIEECSTIDNGIKTGLFKPHNFMKEDVFGRVCDGILKSSYTKPKYRKYFEQQVTAQQISVEHIASPAPVAG